MPPQRTPMGVISGNRQKGKHLTPDMRGKIVGLSLFGSSPTEVAVGLNIEHSTVRYIPSLPTPYAMKVPHNQKTLVESLIL
jgi:hypothetical protein